MIYNDTSNLHLSKVIAEASVGSRYVAAGFGSCSLCPEMPGRVLKHVAMALCCVENVKMNGDIYPKIAMNMNNLCKTPRKIIAN